MYFQLFIEISNPLGLNRPAASHFGTETEGHDCNEKYEAPKAKSELHSQALC
jgi:hypothetical protein